MSRGIYKTKEEIIERLKERYYGVEEPERIASLIYNKHIKYKNTLTCNELDNIIRDILEILDIKEDEIIRKSSTRIYSDDLYNSLRIAVERLRMDLFKKKEPPFNNYEEAIQWIEKEQALYFSDEVLKKRILFDNKFDELCELVSNGEAVGNTCMEYKTLPYKYEELNGMKIILNLNFEHSKILTKLQRESEFYSRIFSFEQIEIVKFILCGDKPELKRYDVKVIPTNRKKVVITLNTSDVTFDEIKAIYDLYRIELNVKNEKRLNNKQEKIINLVKELGEPPSKGTTQYYENLLSEWNKRCPNDKDKYSTYQGLLKAYQNIVKKLNKI